MFLRGLRTDNAWQSTFQHCVRAFSIPSRLLEKPLPPRIVVAEKDLVESFLKGSGPGGQKINKTSSAVQLKHLPTGIVVKNQETRSRDQNRKNARRILGEKLEELEKGPLARTAIKGEKLRKKKASAVKKSKRKYRQLEEAAAANASGAADDMVESPGSSDKLSAAVSTAQGDGVQSGTKNNDSNG